MKSRKLLSFIIAVVLVCGLAACGAPAGNITSDNTGNSGNIQNAADGPAKNIADPKPYPTDEKISLTTDEWPVVDGATAFLPFYTRMASEVLGKSSEEAAGYVLCSTTDYAYPKLCDRKVDMIFCFGPSDEQREYAKRKNAVFEYAPILNEAFVFFVNKDNPVSNVTVQQLHDIYAGKITNWKELGGNDEPITAYQRSEGSGSQTGLYKYVIPQNEVMEAPSGYRIETMMGIIDVVANYETTPGGIGYSYLYFVKNQHYDENIKLLNVEGISPTNEAIASGSYPMINTAYAVYLDSQPEDSPVRKLAHWCTTDAAKRIASELGYVPYKGSEGK